jgi:hypothetical protein
MSALYIKSTHKIPPTASRIRFLLKVTGVNGSILNPGGYSKLTCYWEGTWFGKGNITQNKLHIITGKIQRILVEQLQDHPFLWWRQHGPLKEW